MSVCTWHVPRLAFIGLHSRYDVCTVERQLLIHTYIHTCWPPCFLTAKLIYVSKCA